MFAAEKTLHTMGTSALLNLFDLLLEQRMMHAGTYRLPEAKVDYFYCQECPDRKSNLAKTNASHSPVNCRVKISVKCWEPILGKLSKASEFEITTRPGNDIIK